MRLTSGRNANMQEKRTGQRRNYAVNRGFPLTDDRGCIVPFDRSRIPDRRLNNLKLEYAEIMGIQLQRMTR